MGLDLNAALFANGALSVGAVVFAALAPRDQRRAAAMCAAALTASWMLSCASYTGYAVEKAIGATYLDIWSAMNALIGVLVALIARETWWGRLLFGLLFVACVNDLALWMQVSDLAQVPGNYWEPFSERADWLFWSEAAIFYAIGAGGAAVRIADNFRRLLPLRSRLARPKSLIRRVQ